MSTLAKQFMIRFFLISLVKVVGAIGRIPLFRLLGPEGIGLYQMAYSFFGLCLTLVIGGFPTALSLITAKKSNSAVPLLKFSATILAIVGGLSGIVTFLYAPFFAQLVGGSNLVPSIQLLAPALLLVPFVSLIRGFLQGKEYYGAIALSEIVEQLVRVFVMLTLSFVLIKYGLSYAVGGATFAAVAGALASFVFLLFFLAPILRKSKYLPQTINKSSESTFLQETSFFLKMSFAIFLTRLFVPITDFLDSIIIPNRLMASGLDDHQAIALYGAFVGMASTIVYFPTMITAAISHILTMKISADWISHRDKFQIRVTRGLKAGGLWGICSSFYLLAYSNQLSIVIMGDESIRLPIMYMSIIPLITGLRELSTSILWAINIKKAPIYGLVTGAIISLMINYYFISIPAYRLIGITTGLLSMEVISTLFNLYILYMRTKQVFNLIGIIKEGIGVSAFIALSIVTIQAILSFIPASFLFAAIFTAILYFSFCSVYIWLRLYDGITKIIGMFSLLKF